MAGFAPAANNVIASATFMAFAAIAGNRALDPSFAGRLLLGAGTTGAVAATALLHVRPVRRMYGRIPLRVTFRAPIVTRLIRMSGWTILYVASSQAEVVLALALAYAVQGAATAYTIAFIFAQFPVGVLAVSVMTAVFPALAKRASSGDMTGFARQLGRAVSFTLALVVPTAVAYVILAPSMVSILIERGRVSAADAAQVGRLVQILTVSLPGFSLWLLFLRGFYALQDARTPTGINFIEIGVFCLLDIMLFPWIGVAGLAWSHVLGYALGALLAGRALSRRVGGLEWSGIANQAARVAVAATVSGLVMWVLLHALERRWTGELGRIGVVVAVAASGLAALAASGSLLAVEEFRRLFAHIPGRTSHGLIDE